MKNGKSHNKEIESNEVKGLSSRPKLRRGATTKEFISVAKSVHGDRYNYEKTLYKKTSEKVTISCNAHGPFLQTPANHLKGMGCPLCGNRGTGLKKCLSLEEIIDRFKETHGEKYDYSKVEAKPQKEKVVISCPEHGDFKKRVGDHMRGQGCPKCGNKKKGSPRRKTESEFITSSKDIHGDTYDYSEVTIKNCHTAVKILCKLHGEFHQTPYVHLQGSGCPSCGRIASSTKQRRTREVFVTLAECIHDGEYNYQEVDYQQSHKKIKVVCKKHGPFLVTPDQHLRGSGCGLCFTGTSRGEKEIYDLLSSFVPDLSHRDRTVLGGREIDIYSPSLKLGIEFNGVYYHSDRLKTPLYHYNKYKECLQKGIRLIQICDIDWKTNRKQMEKLLLNAAGATNKDKVSARCCTVVKIESSDCRDFFNANHPQGHTPNKWNYGLITKSGELVAVMSFGFGKTSRGNSSSNRCWELSRYATSCRVRGGASKLFRAFLRDHNPEKVRSFSMNDWFQGGVYKILGFTPEEIKPDYRVYHPKTGLRPKSHWQRREIPKRLLEIGSEICYNSSTDVRTQKEIEELVGAVRLWDSGKTRWTWFKEKTQECTRVQG